MTAWFGTHWHEVYRINGDSGSAEKMALGADVPELSWPMGVAFDSHANRILVVSLGGEGFLYGYSLQENRWSALASMENNDFDSILYHPGLNLTLAFGHDGNLHKLSTDGKIIGTIDLPPTGLHIGPGGYQTEMALADANHIALLVEPDSPIEIQPGQESRIYLIDLQNETAELTYRKIWSSTSQEGVLEIISPQDGAFFRAGETIDLRAAASHPSLQITSVDFYAGEVKIGSFHGSPPPQTFVIEAEDFDFDSGKHQAAADTMPYYGGAYESLGAAHNIDYARDLEVSEGDVYRLGEVPNSPMIAFQEPSALSRGTWSMQVNYRIGWITENTWFNYTRNFPPGSYKVYAGLSHGTTDPATMRGTLAKVVSGAGAASQTLQPLGNFSGTGSGAWTTVQRVPLMNNGQAVTVPLNGPATLRFTGASGDYDYLILENQNTVPGGVVTHSFRWSNAPAGTHRLTARANLPNGQQLVSSPVQITVGQGNRPPVVQIVRPADGAAFTEGSPIEIRVEASDADGSIQQIELRGDGDLLLQSQASPLVYVWRNVSAGQHTLIARATDNSALISTSAPVRVLVRSVNNAAFVLRTLPDAYSPGVPFTVQLKATPPTSARAYAIEDVRPAGWQVSEISHEGTFDAVTGKVKFGPFTDAQARTLSYRLTPPLNASGPREFTGNSSIDGVAYPIGGDRVIDSATRFHPADADQNSSIALVELTAYAADWKAGARTTNGISIPASFVTRAALLWKRGEAYRYDPSQGAPPACWVPAVQTTARVQLLSTAAGERLASSTVSPGVPSPVQISITPPAGVASFAVEEKIPAGWSASNISHDGAFDPRSGCIRWGVFFDSNTRNLSYSLTAPPNVTTAGELNGKVSFDGDVREIGSAPQAVISVGSIPIRLAPPQTETSGTIRFQISAAAGQIGIVQASSDLVQWGEVQAVFLPDGIVEIIDRPASGEPVRFYRFRAQ
jgi:hypothetical protein